MAREKYEFGQVNMKTNLGGRNMKILEKPHNFKKALMSLLHYALHYKWLMILAVICTVGGVVFSLFGPNNLSRMTDLISEGISNGDLQLQPVMEIGIELILLYLASFLLTYLQNFTLITLSQKLGRQLRQDISHKLNRIPLRRFDRSSFGDLLSRVTNDIDTITDSVRQSMGEIISATVLFVGCAILMLKTNVLLAVLAIVISLIGFMGMKLIVRRSQPHFTGTSYCLGAINGHIEEMYAGHMIVKTYNGEKESRQIFSKINKQLYNNSRQSQFLSGIMQPLMEMVSNASYVTVCVVGAILTSQGTITFGTIIAFIVYVKLFTQPLGQVAQAVTGLQSAAAASERVFDYLAEPEMSDETKKIHDFVPTKGQVSFEHVKFGYLPEKTVINDFSIVIKPGQKVAIVGPTGAGKTTIVNLLMRFYELDSGRILIDGTNIADMTRENVHELFGMVLQDTWLFEDTIKNNIIYAKKNVTDQQVADACQAVGLDEFIHQLPKGYDTILTDDSNLSAGQRQLLTIARTMVMDAPLLIMDEATSSVDTHTEQLVSQALEKLTQGRTSFTIAHRLSTIRNADIILVMDKGDIVETGTHDQLLKKQGFYAKLWQSQFVNAETI